MLASVADLVIERWNGVGSISGRYPEWRRSATRYEKRAANDLAMLTIAALLLWL